ncbi:GAF domain-containing protein [Luteimonas sp. RD2P54]|uniref:GAF domain-containing protein n=1 Tax=Luteimonas endophytica TaxID=3042023 RepID=A0ABT6J6M2_9GAMM|nr:GAF domain-containing protein [Luteimonas endophytica]MDH5822480.1 GAF domain-containing protein [Luteimonas endophytica]
MSPDLDQALARCAQEPIHLSGAIQPHGYLISCALPDWSIRHVSANIEALTGIAAADMPRRSLREFLTEDLVQSLSETIGFGEPDGPAQRAAVGNIGPGAQLCDLSVHVAGGLVHIEIEPQPPGAGERSPAVVGQAMIARVAATDDEHDFHQRVAEQVRLLTGYDRVMVYRFRHDDSGEVIAESCAAEMPAYLGLRYPASDIPAQARKLYLRNRIRVIPDAGYAPVPVLPDRGPDGAPLDLGQLALRSVSPVHLEYLRNMGVAASMSISITAGGRLWGLIACHHRSPRLVPPGVRAVADMFGLFVSMRIAAREQRAAVAAEDGARAVRDALGLRLANAGDARLALPTELDLLRRALPCDGAGLWLHDEWHSAGRAPAAAAVPGLLAWLRRDGGAGPVATANAADWADGPDAAGGLAGALALPLDAARGEWLCFFRCEQIQEVRWAGRPDQPFTVDPDGQHIGPRASFAAWSETVRGASIPWSDADQRMAGRLLLVLRERWRREHHQSDPTDLNQQRTRLEMRDQRQRLQRLSELLDGMAHLGPGATTQFAARISQLEEDLQALVRTTEAGEG